MFEELSKQTTIDFDKKSIFLFAGKQRKSQKLIVKSRDAKDYYFCKIARNKNQEQLLVHEYNTINKFFSEAKTGFLVPRPIAQADFAGRKVFCYEFIEGIDLQSLLLNNMNKNLIRKLFQQKINFDRRYFDEHLKLNELSFLKELNLSEYNISKKEIECLGVLHKGFVHGDFIASNIIYNEDFFVNDWEMSYQNGIPLMDIMWFALHLSFKSSYEIKEETIEAYQEIFQQYYKETDKTMQEAAELVLSKLVAIILLSEEKETMNKIKEKVCSNILYDNKTILQLLIEDANGE